MRAIGPGSTGRAFVHGQNYTVWRGSHRVRYGNSWRTFRALSALSVLLIAGTTYCPYASLSAPEPCEGETEDGCILQWQEIELAAGSYLTIGYRWRALHHGAVRVPRDATGSCSFLS